MLTVFALPLLSMQAGEPARTVNGQELGEAVEFSTEGPATVCLRHLVLRPNAGQSVELSYSGIHSGSLRLIMQDGDTVEFTDGEIFRDLRRPGQGPVTRRPDMMIYLVSDRGPDDQYQLEGLASAEEDVEPPRVMMRGSGVAGNRSDERLFDLVSFEDPAEVSCDRRFQYGWGVLLEGEPFDVQSSSEDPEN